VAGIIVVFILFSLAQEMNRRLQIQREVAQLDQEARNLEKSIVEMEQLNQYFKTDSFQERMAREKLNYRAPGEEVVLIPEQDLEQAAVDTREVETREMAIPEKWWRVFFVAPYEGPVV